MKDGQAWRRQSLLTAAEGTVLPTMCFGCELWVKGSALKKAEKAWYRAIKRLLGWHGCYAARAVRKANGLPSVEEYQEHLRRRLCIRRWANPDHPARKGGPKTKALEGEWIPVGASPEQYERTGPTRIAQHLILNQEETAKLQIGEEGSPQWNEWTQRVIDEEVDGREVWATDGSVLADGRTGVGWVRLHGGRAMGPPRSRYIGKGKSSGDAQLTAISLALAEGEGPITILTDSMTAVTWLTSCEANAVPPLAASLRNTTREVRLGWVPGHKGIDSNEAADAAAKEGAERGDPTEPIVSFTVAWARELDTRLWQQARNDPAWNPSALHKWSTKDLCDLIRIRQAAGPCPCCNLVYPGEPRASISKHLMLQCEGLREQRKRTKLHTTTMMGGTPTWEEWLTNEENLRTREYVRAVAAKWDSGNKKPLLGSLDGNPREEGQGDGEDADGD